MSHDFAYADGIYALADAEEATVHLINRETMAVENAWNSVQSAGSLPLIRRVHTLGLQAGFTIVHAGGLAIVNSSGSLLFERFSEAPWSPVDARFSGNTCVLWEKNEATSAHRLRSWDFITGATGPLINLAVEPSGIGSVPLQSSGNTGSIFVVSETAGLTLVDVGTTGNDGKICAGSLAAATLHDQCVRLRWLWNRRNPGSFTLRGSATVPARHRTGEQRKQFAVSRRNHRCTTASGRLRAHLLFDQGATKQFADLESFRCSAF